jgi:Dolichyl-phosphate-mannose-protein mannosyltransferase
MTSEPARSTIALAPARWALLAQRASDYFSMSGPAELIAAAILFALMIVIRVVNMTRYRFDSDEPQHLHVIWGWARGFVQYRDLFDNHMPLFQIMLAPIFGLIGDRATILYWMRFILLPMYFVAAWCTYRLGTLLFSRRAGVWAVILVGFYAGYHFISLEFRTDNLWAPLWLLCVTVLVSGVLTVRRALVAGLLLGLCFGVSMKSVLFLLSILVAAPLTLFLVGRKRLGQSWAHLAHCAAAFFVATMIVPATIMIFFVLKGVWRDFRYCVFDFNFLARRVLENPVVYKSHPALVVIIALFVVVYVAQRMMRASGDPDLAFRRGFVLVVCASYFLVLNSFWPLTDHDNRPPFYPLAFVMFCGALLAFSDGFVGHKWNVCRIFRFIPLPAFVAFGEFFLLVMQPIWKDRTRPETDLLRNVLALTERSDYVFDCIGETVFRQRCFRPVLEKITMKCIRRGIIVDNARQRCVETRTCVVATMLIKRLSPDTHRFVKRNYLPVTNNLRVAGVILEPSSQNPHRFDFEVVIPASYKIISRDASVSGILDGTPDAGARFLAPGPHTFETRSTFNQLVLLWTQAVDRHFTPFDRHPSLGR